MVMVFSSCKQHGVRSILHDKLTELQADSGLVIIIDRNGNIVTNVNLVAENGMYKDGDNLTFDTRRTIGSLFSPVSMLIALNGNTVLPTDVFDVENGVLLVDDCEIRDHNANIGGYGKITAEQVIAFDSNVGIAKIILNGYDSDKFIQSINDLELDVMAEDAPLVKLATGYGIKITPISILSFYNDIASNKVDVLDKMLAQVVKEGTGSPADSEMVSIAGKTGNVLLPDGTREVSFCGYFPADDPEYTCLVIISNPKNGYPSGGAMAGDVVRQIAEIIK